MIVADPLAPVNHRLAVRDDFHARGVCPEGLYQPPEFSPANRLAPFYRPRRRFPVPLADPRQTPSRGPHDGVSRMYPRPIRPAGHCPLTLPPHRGRLPGYFSSGPCQRLVAEGDYSQVGGDLRCSFDELFNCFLAQRFIANRRVGFANVPPMVFVLFAFPTPGTDPLVPLPVFGLPWVIVSPH